MNHASPAAGNGHGPLRVYGIVPPTGVYVREDRCQTPLKSFRTIALRPPIDLMYATAAFEAARAQCELRDYPAQGLGWTDLEANLRRFRPDMAVLSITTQTLADDMQAADLIKRVNPGTVTIAKGAHFNVHDVASLAAHPSLDLVLRGEIEETCLDLGRGRPFAEVAGITWRDPARGIVRNPDRPFTRDLDTLPFPARHLTNNLLYIRPDTGEPQTTLITNRGCPYHCIYCLANQVAGTANRYRSVENVIAEIRQCKEQHGLRNFLFRSDLFTQNTAWVIRLCEAIVDQQLDIEWACNSRVDSITREQLEWMHKAGCWIIAFGVESGDQAALDCMQKNAQVEDAYTAVRLCREVGIKSSVYLLMGLPWDTRESIHALEKFAIDLGPDILEIFYPYPFPGTPLQRQCVELGLLEKDAIPRQSYAAPAYPTLHLSIEELKTLRAQVLRRFYLRPSKVLKILRSARSPYELGNYARVGIAQLRQLLLGE